MKEDKRKEKEPCGDKALEEMIDTLKEINETLKRLQEIQLFFASLELQSLTLSEHQVVLDAMLAGVKAWSKHLSED